MQGTGILFSAAPAAIKYADRLDLGLITTDRVASCAAVFTQNNFAAAPVLFSKETLEQSNGYVSGVIVNSGCANAATGDEGYANAVKMAELARSATSASAPFLVCSTGTIGVQLPMDRIEAALPEAVEALAPTERAFLDFADSIMTTDTVRKVCSVEVLIDGKVITIAGCAKGSGMMHPNMATMLCFLVTDAEIAPPLLQKTFSAIIERTLNCVTVDGDTSTNDTALILANGASGVSIVENEHENFDLFSDALNDVLTSLSRQLARDGEGATHLIEVTVKGAPTFNEARKAALAVANSPLVKTAIYGRDANWGRIACALGNSSVPFDATKTDIRMGILDLMIAGNPLPFSEDEALAILSQDEINIVADLKNGAESATVWTCDLTEKYIEINGSYRT